jgi:CPSF A subunit region
LGKDVNRVEYFEQHGLYAFAINTPEEFLVLDDEGQPKEPPEGNPLGRRANPRPPRIPPPNPHKSSRTRPPRNPQNGRHVSPPLMSPDTSFPLPKHETIMCLKLVTLQISEESKRRRTFLAMGTAHLRGEDAGVKGTLYVFDVSQVVPQPDRPETNRKLRVAWSEEVRGAVTVINEVHGYLLSSQGQKVMVRAFGENDKEFLPVAFYDLSMVVTVASCLRDFILFGDIMHSICFVGFQVC